MLGVFVYLHDENLQSLSVGLTVIPLLICPQPINLRCLSILRERAIFSPTSVQTGVVRPIFAKSALTAITLPPVESEPMFTINTSFLASF